MCLIVLSRLSAANSHDRLIEEPNNRGPDKRGFTVLVFSRTPIEVPVVQNNRGTRYILVAKYRYCSTSFSKRSTNCTEQ